MINTSNQVKRKTVTDKEVIEFLVYIEEKLENNTEKLQSFLEIFSKLNNSSEEEILAKIHEMFADEPFIILELNKILPKCNRLPHVDADYGIKLLNKLKSTDEALFGECMKALLNYKNLEITIDTLIEQLEEILKDLPEVLDDFLLFLDYKRVNTAIPIKKLPEPIQPEIPVKKAKVNQNLMREREKEKEREYEQEDSNLSTIQPKQKSMSSNYSKSSGNPDYLFFDSLKKIMDENSFKILIKLLHLYVEVLKSF